MAFYGRRCGRNDPAPRGSASWIIRPSNGHLESTEKQFTIQRVALGELKTVAERRQNGPHRLLAFEIGEYRSLRPNVQLLFIDLNCRN